MKSLIQNSSLALQLGEYQADGKVTFSGQVLAVLDIADASTKWEAIRDAQGYERLQGTTARVVDTITGEQIAKITYNGRAWAADGSEIPLPGYKTAAQHDAEGWSDYTTGNVTASQLRAQYTKNAVALQAFADLARKHGGKHRGQTADYWQAKADEYKAKGRS
jgi:hypothetical protein